MPPAVRVAVLVFFDVDESVIFFENFDDVVIGTEHVLSGEEFGIRQKTAVTANRVVNFETVFATQHKVILAMAGCRVHCTSTRFEGDVITNHEQRLARIKRMLQLQALQSLTFATGHNL